jgi:hypothetical protein
MILCSFSYSYFFQNVFIFAPFSQREFLFFIDVREFVCVCVWVGLEFELGTLHLQIRRSPT